MKKIILAVATGILFLSSCTPASKSKALELKYTMIISENTQTSDYDVRLLLGKDKLSQVKGEAGTYFDIAAKKLCVLGPDIGENSYTQFSLYSLVAAHEQMMEMEGDEFERESFSGLLLEKEHPNPGITKVDNQYKKEYYYRGNLYATVEYGNAFPPLYERTMEKALIFLYRLHPYLRSEILASKKMVKKLIIIDAAEGRKTKFMLESSKEVDYEPEIPSTYKRVFDPKSPIKNLQEKIITPEKLPPLPTKDAVFAESKKMLKRGEQVDAFLNMNEYMFTSGDECLEEMKFILKDSKDNPTLVKLGNNISPANEEEAEEALAQLKTIDLSKLKKGYVAEIFIGDVKDQIGQDGLPDFLKALNKNPYMTGAYVDLGMHFLQKDDFNNAWGAFEMFRKIMPNHRFGESIVANEKRLEEKYPECFSY